MLFAYSNDKRCFSYQLILFPASHKLKSTRWQQPHWKGKFRSDEILKTRQKSAHMATVLYCACALKRGIAKLFRRTINEQFPSPIPNLTTFSNVAAWRFDVRNRYFSRAISAAGLCVKSNLKLRWSTSWTFRVAVQSFEATYRLGAIYYLRFFN